MAGLGGRRGAVAIPPPAGRQADPVTRRQNGRPGPAPRRQNGRPGPVTRRQDGKAGPAARRQDGRPGPAARRQPGARAWRPAAAALTCAALLGLALSGCGAASPQPAPTASQASTAPASQASTAPASASPASTEADPETKAALLRIAQAFNNAYDNGDFGTTYDRWDARSQAIISRAEYIRRHLLCAPATHTTAVVTAASRAAGGAWHVGYEIGGQQLTDTWFYAGHRWVFDILLSNPGAARLYRLPFARYAAAIGCNTH